MAAQAADPKVEIFDAIRAGDKDRVQALLRADPGVVNARSDRGYSPVLIAQYHQQKALVEILLAAGPVLDIWDAASVGDSKRVGELLDRDPSLLNAYAPDGFFPLALAAFFGYPETVKLLLARGADPAQAAKNPMKITALHSAVTNSLESVKALVGAGAPVNAKQDKGWAPLHEAVNRGDLEMTRYLLEHGADPRQQNDAGTSAIGLAAEKNAPEILKLLKGAKR
ncbi:MAG TPA: ankyrin repeat domain-containing protein [Gemmatimonadales bacterium]|nr:ankyrin repeat domain-containing protein [Gemmatimonadales bacterium]